ncbi:ROK family protein [Pantoea coffeiphila]|uniref:Transcriptional regulator n=1 Tax=Pantoea coffeiphila TaxID=1465635 RepID=A0A2S9IHN6_9GAMM|nr:ROK family protein [Pantoea coffeiphila]PRD17306.1 transcriptional regulator [Pantoea coffeiphila]
MHYLGLDIGGTKMAAVVMNATGEEIARYRRTTVKIDYPAFIGELCDFVAEIRTQSQQPLAMGIALPGGISPASGKIKNSNILVLNGQDLKTDLEQRLDTAVVIANDAKCFALSEACDGAGKGAEVVFGITLGTGCGGGMSVKQQIFTGAWGNAAECGHITLPDYAEQQDGPLAICYCGRQNCVESFVSGTGLAERYFRLTGEQRSAPEIIRLAQQGEPQALQQISRFRSQLARLLATIVNIVDPNIIVLGGGLSNEPLLLEGLAEATGERVFTDRFLTPIVVAQHGDSSGMRGAAWLAIRSQTERSLAG